MKIVPRVPASLRGSSGKSSGGQKGHEGSTLKMSATPDHTIEHQPGLCNCCGLGLDDQQGELSSRSQVIDIPVIRPSYTEHRIFRKTCACGDSTRGTFPSGVEGPISYGPGTTALIAYLHNRSTFPWQESVSSFLLFMEWTSVRERFGLYLTPLPKSPACLCPDQTGGVKCECGRFGSNWNERE